MVLPLRIRSAHVEHLGAEVCVYDWKRNEVHALNPIAASVWQQSDGRTTPAQIAARLSAELKTDDAEALVWVALGLLSDAHLLERPITLPSHHVSVSRRDLIKRLGQAAALLPAISSIVAPTPLQAQSATSQTFDYTGAVQVFVVPGGITQITVAAYGAGGGVFVGLEGGGGGLVTATIAVTPGEVLNVYVGGAGPDSVFLTPTQVGGFNGGGGSTGNGAGGGGASDIRRGNTKLVVGGGGGGRGNGGGGGSGGGTTAADGNNGTSAGPRGGGTQTVGGAGGTAGISGTPGTAGSAGTGGVGGAYTGPERTGGGGGGGGFFGGGGGGGGRGPIFPSLGSGGGGGGSSYADPAATNVTHSQGVHVGHGQIVISFL